MTRRSCDKAGIKHALEKAGWTLTSLAEFKGLNANGFRAVWSRVNRPAQEAIAEVLGKPVEELFPDRYPILKARILSIENEAAIASQKRARHARKAAA